MNLSHVERYFSDFLSVMESGESIHLHDSQEVEDDFEIPRDLYLPSNLYVIGTINVDETTYMFSPKVLDRANVIEFSTVSALDYLKDDLYTNKDLNVGTFSIDTSLRNLKPVEIFQKLDHISIDDSKTSDFKTKLSYEINTFQTALGHIGFDFGFRVINELIIFMYLAWKADGEPNKWDSWANAFDSQILQKMLPKIHGSAKVIGNMLKCLYCLCFSGKSPEYVNKLCNGEIIPDLYKKDISEARYKRSAKKLKKMQSDLESQRYISFT